MQRFDWRQVESTNYIEYIQNLRAIGCPEMTIRDIVVADVNALFENRERQRRVATNGIAFWKAGSKPKRLARDRAEKAHQELETERVAILKQLLGSDFAVPSRPLLLDDDEITTSLLDFLPEGQREVAGATVKQLNAEFSRKFTPVWNSGNWNADARSNYIAYVQEKDEQLTAALGREGRMEYEMRDSPLSNFLRLRFQGVDFTEQEFRQLYTAAEPYGLQGTVSR